MKRQLKTRGVAAIVIYVPVSGSSDLNKLCRELNRTTKGFFAEHQQAIDSSFSGVWTWHGISFDHPLGMTTKCPTLVFSGLARAADGPFGGCSELDNDHVSKMMDVILKGIAINFVAAPIVMYCHDREFIFTKDSVPKAVAASA